MGRHKRVAQMILCPLLGWSGSPTAKNVQQQVGWGTRLLLVAWHLNKVANKQQHLLLSPKVYSLSLHFCHKKHEASLLAMIESVLMLRWAGGGHWVCPSGLESGAAPNPLTSHFSAMPGLL